MPYESFFYVCPIFVFVDIVATRAMCSTLVMLEAMTDERLTSTCSVIFYFDRSDSRRFVFLPIYPFLSYIYAPFSSLNSFFFNLYFCIFVFLIPPATNHSTCPRFSHMLFLSYSNRSSFSTPVITHQDGFHSLCLQYHVHFPQVYRR